MKALASALLALLCIAAVSASSQEPAKPKKETFSRPKAEAYLDESTGVEFPAKLGLFVKSQVVRNSNPYYGTVVRYSSSDGSCADVYIYSLGSAPDPEQLKLHFKSVLKVIESLPASSGGPVKAVSFKDEAKMKLGSKGSIEAYKADFSFEAAGSLFDSNLALFAFKDKVVKMRVSRPSGSKVDGDAFVSGIARLFETAASKDAQPPAATAAR